MWIRPLGGLLALLATVECSVPGGHQPAVPETVNGFTVGEVYVVTQLMKAVTWGERTSLVPEMRLGKDAAKPAAVHDIEPGTRILVTAIRQHNTITHGMESWPEGVIGNGPLEGTRVALGHAGLSGHTRRAVR